MFRFTAKVVIVLISITNVYAQSKFEPGYIVASSNDTIRGMIEYRNWSQNPESILFRDEKLQTEKILGLKDLLAFEVHGESYERAVVSRNTALINNNDLPENSLPVLETDTVFLTKLVAGPKSFHYLKDRSNKVQLYIGAEHELLIYHKYKIIKENQTQLVTVNGYRQQLKAYLDCPETENRIQNLRYSNKDILNLFEIYYNKCAAAKPDAITRRDGLRLEAGALAGVTFTKVKFTGYDFPYLSDRSHSISVRPTGGFFLNIVIPRTRKSFLIVNELTYSSYKISGQFRTEVNPENFTTTDFTFAINHARVNNLVRYRISRGNAFFYANVGISNGFIISEDNRFFTRTQFYTDVYTKEEKLETRKHDQGIIIGIGAGLRKFGLEARFENSNGNSSYVSTTSNVRRIALLVSYKF